MIVNSGALADTSEVHPNGEVAQREGRFGERLDHLVVEGAAMQLVRMRDQCDCPNRIRPFVDHHFQWAGVAVDQQADRGLRLQIRSRSTMRPFWRCSSMISSTSSWSTYVYQISSG